MSVGIQNNMTVNIAAKLEPVIEEFSNRLPQLIHLTQASLIPQESKVHHNNNSINSTISHPPKRPRPRRPRATQRERQRMQLLNQAFENLRRVVPRTHLADYQRLSKIATLRLAIQYIKTMNQILAETNNNNNNNIDSVGSRSVFQTTTGQVVKNSLLLAASQSTNPDLLNGLSSDNQLTQSYEQRFDVQEMICNPVYSESGKRFHYNSNVSPPPLQVAADMQQQNSGPLFYPVNSGTQYPNLSHYNQARLTDW